jgi:hypothetical protein
VKPRFFPNNIKELLIARKNQLADKNQKWVSITSDMYQLIMNS